MIGKTVAQYHILEQLGSGGMGVVYKAEDTRLNRHVALKFLPAELTRDPDAKQRFVREAQAASALQHDNICTIHEISESEDGQMFICMDYYDGEALNKVIEQGPLNLVQAIDIAQGILQGLKEAHEKDQTHRDIKPANVIITSKGSIKILDFGLTVLAGQTRLTKDGSTVGTLAYMSPEQTRGEKVDKRTDIWALGVALYEMVSGQTPFKGDYDQAVMYSIINEQPEPLTALRTGVPMELERIVTKAMAKNVAERYQNADDILVDLISLRKTLESSDSVAQSVSRPAQKPPKTIKKWMYSLALLPLLILAYYFLSPLLISGSIAEQKPVVVISFKNQTGDPAYDYLQDAIPNLLITSLEQSKYLYVIPWERMYDILKQIGREDVDYIDEELAFEICRMEGVESIVLGSFVKAGDIFATDVKVLDVASKQLIKSAKTKGEGVGSILQNQIDALSREISENIIYSELDYKGTELRISDVTTHSMEAYHYFLKGRDAFEKLYFKDAVQFLEKAIEIDSTFAIAYLYLGGAHGALYNYGNREFYYEKAKIHSHKSGKKDRMYIEARYAYRIEKNRLKMVSKVEEIIKLYPKEKRAFLHLGVDHYRQKQYDKAVNKLEKALELDPLYGSALNMMAYVYGNMADFEKAEIYLRRYSKVMPGDANPFDSMAELYLKSERIDEAIQKYQEAFEIKPEAGSAFRLSYVYALIANYDDAIHWIDLFISTAASRGYGGAGLWWMSIYQYVSGQRQLAFKNLKKGSELGIELNNTFGISLNEALTAWIFLDQDDPHTGLTHFKNAYKFGVTYSPQFIANLKAESAFYRGLCFLKQAKIDSAIAEAEMINNLIPDLTPLVKEGMLYSLDYLQTEIFVATDSIEKAVLTQKMARKPKTPFTFTLNFLKINFPFRRDGLAQLFRQNGDIESAIAQYQMLVDSDPGEREWAIINPIYYYQLGKLYEMKNDLSEAKKYYETYLTICKKADDDIPEIIDARQRIVHLNNTIIP